jgi:hypothetical protein
MNLFYILNVLSYVSNDGFTFTKKPRYYHTIYKFELSADDFPTNEFSRIITRDASDHVTQDNDLSTDDFHELSADDFPVSDEENIQPISSALESPVSDEENLETILKKRQKSQYDGCDQRPLNIPDPNSLLYFYKEFREMLQKQDLLQKLQSGSYNNIEKLKIIEECDYLLENEYKPKIKPLYKGFEDFFDF